MNNQRFIFALCVFDFVLSFSGMTETATIKPKTVRGRPQISSIKKIILQTGCIPEKRSVNLPVSSNETVYPSCVRLNQCGGCCENELKECQPDPEKSVEHIFTVRVIPKFERNPRAVMKNITLFEHHACQCVCKYKATDCPAHKIYNKDTCRCDCPNNVQEILECNNQDNQRWNSTLCECVSDYELLT